MVTGAEFSAMGRPHRQQCIEPRGVDPAEQATVDLDRRPEGTVAEAEDLLQRRLTVARGVADIDAQVGRGPSDESLTAEGLTGLGATDPDRAPPGRLLAEVLVERDDSVDVGRRDVQLLSHHRYRGARDVAESVLHIVQDLDQRPVVASMVLHRPAYGVEDL